MTSPSREGGDHGKPGFAAGLGLQLAGRMLFDFKGSIFWRMNAGTGEAIFAPMYEALVRRGVEFRFFRRLDDLGVSHGNSIETIELTRQAELSPGRSSYEPLVRVGVFRAGPTGHSSTSSTATQGRSPSRTWSPREGTGTETLVAGRDFDVAVLAVSLGMVPFVASGLVARDPAWRAMVDGVATVATRSAQLWFTSSESDLGWKGPTGVTLSGFGDLRHVGLHDPPPRAGVLAIHRGAAEPGLPLLSNARHRPAMGETAVRDTLVGFLEREVGSLWPGTSGPSGFPGRSCGTTRAASGLTGWSAQYVRANSTLRPVRPVPPGSGRYRLAPGGPAWTTWSWPVTGPPAGSMPGPWKPPLDRVSSRRAPCCPARRSVWPLDGDQGDGSPDGARGARHIIGEVQRFGLLSAASVVDRYVEIINRESLGDPLRHAREALGGTTQGSVGVLPGCSRPGCRRSTRRHG